MREFWKGPLKLGNAAILIIMAAFALYALISWIAGMDFGGLNAWADRSITEMSVGEFILIVWAIAILTRK